MQNFASELWKSFSDLQITDAAGHVPMHCEKFPDLRSTPYLCWDSVGTFHVGRYDTCPMKG
jgi:hypothetical protein